MLDAVDVSMHIAASFAWAIEPQLNVEASSSKMARASRRRMNWVHSRKRRACNERIAHFEYRHAQRKVVNGLTGRMDRVEIAAKYNV